MQLLFRPLSTSKEKGASSTTSTILRQSYKMVLDLQYYVFPFHASSFSSHVSCIIWPSIISKGRKQGCFSKGNFTQSIILKKRVFLLKKQNLLSLHLDSSLCGSLVIFLSFRFYVKSILANFIKEL